MRAIEAAFPSERICGEAQLTEFSGDASAFDVLHGHVGFDVAQRFDCEPCVILRDPIDRVLSLFNFWQTRTRNPEADDNAAVGLVQGMDFETFLQSDHPRLQSDLRNGQTFQIAGSHKFPARRTLEEQSRPAVLEQAKRNLDGFAVVGTTDRLDLFEKRANAYFDLDLKIAHRNRTKKQIVTRDCLSSKELNLIHEMNALDIELFGYASQTTGEP